MKKNKIAYQKKCIEYSNLLHKFIEYTNLLHVYM